eukprot:g3600.t1
MCEIPKISIDGKTCKGTPYTMLGCMRCLRFDKKKRCDGWKGLTEAQCLAKCRSNAKASRCPQKVCRAAVFYPSSGWCHLYDQCDELKEFASARFLGDEVPMRSIEGKRCKLTPYTINVAEGCNGWGGLTKEECARKCTGNEQAPKCAQKLCHWDCGWMGQVGDF